MPNHPHAETQLQKHAVLQSRLMKQVNLIENYECRRKFYVKLFERQDLKY